MIHLLSAGACKGLFQALFPKALANGQCIASFGAVGAMRDRLLGGEPCDLLVLTLGMLEELASTGWVVPKSMQVLGAVGTGIAIPSEQTSAPQVHMAAHLKANLLAASAIHFPDPSKATAGIHFQRVLSELGIAKKVAPRCHHYPNGATAMAALAKNVPELGSLQMGCTQVSEILYTEGLELMGELPPPFVLRTTYAVALTPAGLENPAAGKMLEKLCDHNTQKLRVKGGFL